MFKYFSCLFYIYLFFVTQGFTQANSYAQKYFYYANKAELSIVDSNYSQAIKFYDSSFKFLKPFAQDIYNLTICIEYLFLFVKSKWLIHW